MDSTPGMVSAREPVTAESKPPLSPFARVVAIFTNPAGAWAGLESRSQWWLPLILILLCAVAFSVTLNQRAILPMLQEKWEQSVDSGQMTQQQLDRTVAFMSGPTGLIMSAVQQIIAWPLILLIMATLVMFAVGFILGTKLRFRLAFEVVTWSSLVLIPSYLVTWVLAWQRETLKGIHLGLGALVPESDPATKLQVGLAAFADAFGPFNLWFLIIAILGAAALSGAPRKSVAWVMVGTHIVLSLILAAMAGIFTPGT